MNTTVNKTIYPTPPLKSLPLPYKPGKYSTNKPSETYISATNPLFLSFKTAKCTKEA